MRLPLTLLVVAALALSGCADDAKDKDDKSASSTTTTSGTLVPTGSSTPTGSSSATASSSSTGTGAPANRAPSSTVTAAPTAGSVPLTVNFTLGGADADGDALSWTLSFGDGSANATGTALPGNATHSYAAAGLYNATLTVSDGKLSSSSTVAINATAGAAAGGGNTQSTAGEWVTGSALSCGQYADGVFDPYQETPLEGVEFSKFDIVPGTIGKAFLMDVKPASPAGGPMELQFYDASGAGTDFFDSANPTSFDISGTVPAGSAFAVLFPCVPGPGEFLYTVS